MIIDSDCDAAMELSRIMRQPDGRRIVERSYATVISVDGARCSVRFDGEVESDRPHSGVFMTTSCIGATPGDRVLVDTFDHMSTVTGIIAR